MCGVLLAWFQISVDSDIYRQYHIVFWSTR